LRQTLAVPKHFIAHQTPRNQQHQASNTTIMDALGSAIRPILSPIAKGLPKPIADVGENLLGPVCYQTLLRDVDLTKTECVKLAISKGLGIGIIGASSIVKIPQLLKLLNSQSAEGLSFLSYVLESGAYLISLSYNVRHGFPFSTYGETALILIQNIAIASLVLNYSGRQPAIAAWIAGLAGAGYLLFNENQVNEANLSLAMSAAGVLGVAAKIPQILTIWTEGGTGQLSAFAVSHPSTSVLLRQILTELPGYQLPSRLRLAHLYHLPRSRRPAHPLRLRCRLCA
jgi:mannose-P-dolichol utilization defect protein 1